MYCMLRSPVAYSPAAGRGMSSLNRFTFPINLFLSIIIIVYYWHKSYKRSGQNW